MPTKSIGGQELKASERDILQNYIEVEDNQAHITKHLDRETYSRMKIIFERLGGVYMPGRKRFEFVLDPSPLIAQTIALGALPRENPLDFYSSPRDVIKALFAQLEWGGDLLWHYENLDRSIRVLEPSAGLGHLADAFRARYPNASIDVCELDPYRRAVLQAKGYRVVAEDFLQYHPSYSYDVILMNPPFSINGDSFTFIKHITHAEKMLADTGWSKLVSVVPAQFSRMERYQAFHIHVLEVGDYEELPQGAFVESGTKWETSIIELGRNLNPFYANGDTPHPEDGYPNQRLKAAWMYISVDELLSTAYQQLIRDMVEGKLVVYSNGSLAPDTIARIHAFYQQVTHRLLYSYKLHIPFTQRDESFMERHTLNDYYQARDEYSEIKRMEWERSQRRLHLDLSAQVQKAATGLQRYHERLAVYEREMAQSTSALEEFEKGHDHIPNFTPAAQPPAPNEASADLRKLSAPRHYQQLAFF